MSVWLLDTLLDKQEEAFLFDHHAIAFSTPLPDLSLTSSEHELRQLFRSNAPEETPERIAIDAAHVWKFIDQLLPEDKVALICNEGKAIRIAEITGPYYYAPDAPETLRHLKPVHWLHTQSFPVTDIWPDYRQPPRPALETITDKTRRERLMARAGLSVQSITRYIPWVIALLLLLRLITMAVSELRSSNLW